MQNLNILPLTPPNEPEGKNFTLWGYIQVQGNQSLNEKFFEIMALKTFGE